MQQYIEGVVHPKLVCYLFANRPISMSKFHGQKKFQPIDATVPIDSYV